MTPRRPNRVRRRAPTPADVVVLLALVVAIPASHVWTRPVRAGALLVVQCGDAAPRFLDPRQDCEVAVEGPLGSTRVRLQDGRAWIASSPCRNRICQGLGRLEGPGRFLVCLPNRVLVRFAGPPRGADAVSH